MSACCSQQHLMVWHCRVIGCCSGKPPRLPEGCEGMSELALKAAMELMLLCRRMCRLSTFQLLTGSPSPYLLFREAGNSV